MRLLALPVLLGLAAGAHAAQPIAGHWVTENGHAVVTVAPCGAAPVSTNRLCGRVSRVLIAVPGGPATDINNPDPALRKQPIVGMAVLSGFTDAGDDWRGRIYDPESGKSYKSVVVREPGGLKVQGCVLMFCRTQHWKPAG